MNVSLLRLLKLLALSALALLVAAASGQPAPSSSKKASKARIVDFEVEIEGEQVLVSFKLVNALDEKRQRRLESGLATGIVFDFALVRKRRLWFNKTLDRGELEVSAMYNAVSREYLVNYKHDGSLIDSRLVRDPEELYRAMFEFEKLDVLSLAGRKGSAVVQVRAELGTRSLFFFIPTLRTTDWVEERITIERNGRRRAEGE